MSPSYQNTESKAVDAIKKVIPSSLKQDMLKESKGMFAELFENNEIFPKHYIATAIDGVGTKVVVAEAMHKFDTIGIDCVAMSANDLATLGAVSPFLFMDYLACQSKFQEEKFTGDLIKGVVKGLEQCNSSSILRNSVRINFGKGETASVDELISSATGYGFDIGGCMIGFIDKKKFNRQKIKPGQKIIALKSSGPHSNGYTDLRLNLLNGDFETRIKEFSENEYFGDLPDDENHDQSILNSLSYLFSILFVLRNDKNGKFNSSRFEEEYQIFIVFHPLKLLFSVKGEPVVFSKSFPVLFP